MSDFKAGLEGVVAFETEIAEPDKEGGALRYRGVDIDDLVGVVPYERVWGLLVDGSTEVELAPAEPWAVPVHSGDVRVDVQSALAMLAPHWGLGQLLDIDDGQARDDLARASAASLSFVAQAARGLGRPVVPERRVEEATSMAERFITRWRGEADPLHVRAVDAYWVTAAEHGMNASTFTARVIAGTGADVAACLSGAVGALSGPLHGGAPARVLTMLDDVEREGDAARWVRGALDRGERLMGFGHRVYRAEDPRAKVLRRMAEELGCPRYEVARSLERGCSRRTGRSETRPGPAHQRRVLVGGGARPGPDPARAVHGDVRLRPRRRMERPRSRAEANGSIDSAFRPLHRAALHHDAPRPDHAPDRLTVPGGGALAACSG